jgi:hypothetical protein
MTVCALFSNLKRAKWLQLAVTPDPASSNSETISPNDYYYLQRAVTPDWMGSIAL